MSMRSLGSLVNRALVPVGFRIARANDPPANALAGQTAAHVEAELEYWRGQLSDLMRSRYGLELSPIQADVATAPAAELVVQIQNPNKANHTNFIASGLRQACLYLRELHDYGYDPRRFGRILEFGVGLGRLIRHYFPFPAELHGCDVTDAVLDFTRKSLGGRVRLERTSLQTPLPYDADSFDYVYANSVFTHIRLADTPRWIAELARVARAGACVIATVMEPNRYLVHLAEREFDASTASGHYEWGRTDTVRENFLYSTDKELLRMWGACFDVLELRRQFKDQSHLILRKRAAAGA
jgi:hypothetical protein